MEYMGDDKFWDEKFASRSDELLGPEKSLVDNIEYFKVGSVLDIACGDGRNSMFLLEKGFEVTGVDFSSRALERLNRFANRKNYTVETKMIDLSDIGALSNIGVFDNIIINHYRLSKEVLANIHNHISENGILFACGFGHKHQADERIRKEDLIQPSDFEEIKKTFGLVKYMENKDDRGFFVTYIFRKISN